MLIQQYECWGREPHHHCASTWLLLLWLGCVVFVFLMKTLGGLNLGLGYNTVFGPRFCFLV